MVKPARTITMEEMKQLISRADANKGQKAVEQLAVRAGSK